MTRQKLMENVYLTCVPSMKFKTSLATLGIGGAKKLAQQICQLLQQLLPFRQIAVINTARRKAEELVFPFTL